LSEPKSSATLEEVKALVARGSMKISNHGYDELAADNIFVDDAVVGLDAAIVVKDYPEYAKGPCVLALQKDKMGLPLNLLRGIPKGKVEPAVLITASRPDPKEWEDDFQTRRS
jgi:hypothetical protein